MLDLCPSLEFSTKAAAAIQVADHGLGQNCYGFTILCPLQLLLAGSQLFEHVFEPEQVRFALAHGTPLSRCILAETALGEAITVPMAPFERDPLRELAAK
jgi:hypothetical protein